MADFVFIDHDRLRAASGTRVLKAQTHAVFETAHQILAQARHQADQIIAEAEARFQSEKQRGLAEGLREAQRQAAALLAETAQSCERHCRELERETIDLVMAVLKKVLADIDPQQLVTAQVKKALTHFKGRGRLVVKAHPAQAELLQQSLAEIMAGNPALAFVEVKPVAHLTKDQLIVESDTGIAEASLAVQLTAITQAMETALAQAAPPA